ncbi:MAG: hypothetical protein QW117_02850 [Candidatus Pacearchaeota archaeon]
MKNGVIKKEKNSNFKKIFIIILISIIILLLSLLIFSFKYQYKCKDHTCFNSAVINCQRSYYLDDSVEATWEYRINGIEKKCLSYNKLGFCLNYEKRCLINVKLLMIKEGKKDLQYLVGEEMNCYITKEEAISLLNQNKKIKPQSNLDKCSGKLKEDIQNIIIKNLWGIIIKNLGTIQEEVRPI